MNTWFEVKVKFNKIDEKGKDKIVTELYLFDAVSFTDAEKRAHEELKPYIQGEFAVKTIKISKLAEIIPFDQGDYWFEVSSEMVVFDADKAKENKTLIKSLILADDIEQALFRYKEKVNAEVVPYIITNLKITKFVDIFPYNQSDEN